MIKIHGYYNKRAIFVHVPPFLENGSKDFEENRGFWNLDIDL